MFRASSSPASSEASRDLDDSALESSGFAIARGASPAFRFSDGTTPAASEVGSAASLLPSHPSYVDLRQAQTASPLVFKQPPPLRQKSKKSKKTRKLSAIVVGVILLAISVFLAVHFILVTRPRDMTIPPVMIAPGYDPTPALSVSNEKIIFENGTEFRGRGVNLGAWFIMNAEFGGLPGLGEFEFFNVSDSRWGQQVSQELMELYVRNSMSDTDWDLLVHLGFKFVRLPLHFRNFQWANGTWIRNAKTNEIDWSLLDSAITNITAKGLYVQIDYHIWHGRDILYEAVSKAEPWLPPALAAFCERERQMAADFVGNLTAHLRGVHGIMGVEFLNESVPSYGNTLSQVLFRAARNADPDRLLMVYYGSDRPDPAAYGWTNVVYSFHTYDQAQNYEGFVTDVKSKTSDSFNVPYYVSEMHVTDPADFMPSLRFSEEFKPANIPLSALWTYKAVNFNNWALVNYDSTFELNMRVDSLEKIKATWNTLPQLNLAYSLSQWGQEFWP
ncbi:hypothetical protein HDU98_003005 [Podochytrium sp. JEL0797]|nr:hypothetical protein HDU98_003005 [Podochytrium sp. JEL0797]